MTEKQQNLFQLFKEFDAICRENGLKYVMAGGTAIGVVRNEGFIPWDDDMDVYMTREDWEKFVEACETALPPHRAILSLEVDRAYTNSFARYGSADGCAIHKHQIVANDVAGEVIDVLTLDPIPADDKEYEKYRTHLMIYSDLVNPTILYSARWDIPFWKYVRYLLSDKILGRDRTLKKLEKIMFSAREEDCSRYAMRWGGCPFLFDKDMMFPIKEMTFEGMKVMVPNRLNDYLVWHYGDEWCYIPPHTKRESHEAITVPGSSYQEVRADYLPWINKRKLKRDLGLRKLYYMANAKRANRLHMEQNRLKAKSVSMSLNQIIRTEGANIKELAEKRHFHKLNHIFKEYFQVQLSAEMIGREDYTNIYPFYHPTLVEVSDENFLAAMKTLFYTERIGKAYRMLQVKEQLGTLTEAMKELRTDILRFRESVNAYEFGEMEKSEQIVTELLEKYPNHPGFLKLAVRFVMERAKKDGRYAEAENFLEKAQKEFPEDGYFLKFQGDLLWMKGKCADALELFAEAREKTSNGFTHLELDKFLKQYREDTMKTCQLYLDMKRKDAAMQLMELWRRLLPEDDMVKEWYYYTRVCIAGKRSSMEAIIAEIMKQLDKRKASDYKPEEETEDIALYRKALTKAWERLGYPHELAEIRTEILYTEDLGELEWQAEKAKDCKLKKEKRAEVYKVIGDVRKLQGQTTLAFENYRKALLLAGEHSYVKTELARIFMGEFYFGAKKARSYAKKADAAEYLDEWLGKFGSIEEIQEIAGRLER